MNYKALNCTPPIYTYRVKLILACQIIVTHGRQKQPEVQTPRVRVQTWPWLPGITGKNRAGTLDLVTHVSMLHRFLQTFTFEWGQFDPPKYGPYKLLMRTVSIADVST